MVLFRRPPKRDEDDVQWLRSTGVRASKRKPWLIWLVLLFGAGLSVFGVTIALLPKPAQETAKVQPRPDPPAAPSPAPAPSGPAVQQPALPESVTAQPPAPTPEEPSPPARAEDVAPTEQAAEPAPASQWSGAFPSSGASADPDEANFAAYLHEGAPDQATAQVLVVEAQRRYAEALAGRRLTYRRVRVGDEYMWRLRLGGLTQAQALEACERLSAMGAGCEIGPR